MHRRDSDALELERRALPSGDNDQPVGRPEIAIRRPRLQRIEKTRGEQTRVDASPERGWRVHVEGNESAVGGDDAHRGFTQPAPPTFDPFEIVRPILEPVRDQEGLREAVAALRSLTAGRVCLGGHSYGGRQVTILASSDPQVAEVEVNRTTGRVWANTDTGQQKAAASPPDMKPS